MSVNDSVIVTVGPCSEIVDVILSVTVGPRSENVVVIVSVTVGPRSVTLDTIFEYSVEIVGTYSVLVEVTTLEALTYDVSVLVKLEISVFVLKMISID